MKPTEILILTTPDGNSIRGAQAKFTESVTIGSRIYPAGIAVPVALTPDNSGKPQLSAILGDALTVALSDKEKAVADKVAAEALLADSRKAGQEAIAAVRAEAKAALADSKKTAEESVAVVRAELAEYKTTAEATLAAQAKAAREEMAAAQGESAGKLQAVQDEFAEYKATAEIALKSTFETLANDELSDGEKLAKIIEAAVHVNTPVLQRKLNAIQAQKAELAAQEAEIKAALPNNA